MSGFVFSEKPIRIDRGDGLSLIGTDGTRYLDAGASYACTPAGHCHPQVVEAICEQATALVYVQGSYPVAARTVLSERLAACSPDGLENVWLCNSGTEANEAALKFARSATGRTKIVATEQGFHGRTMGALSATWKPKYRAPYEPLLTDVEFVPYGDADALAEAVDEETAAVILEPIQGEGGVNVPPAGYLAAARERTAETGTALIVDEIQTGLGRTGSLWACEGTVAGDQPVTPDVLTTAKGLASGLPLGATLCADWIAEGAASHGSTFSGNPLVCAAADATLAVIADEDLVANAARMGSFLRDGLADTGVDPATIRGEGLLLGIEVERATRLLRELALDHQVLALPAGRRILRLIPPLTLDESAADTLIDALTSVLVTTEVDA